jgi:hypothetical protein
MAECCYQARLAADRKLIGQIVQIGNDSEDLAAEEEMGTDYANDTL